MSGRGLDAPSGAPFGARPLVAAAVGTALGGRPLAAAAGIVADRLLGEPPLRPHPVAAFGAAMRAVERRAYADSRPAGAAHAAVGLALGALGGAAVGSTAAATYLAVAGRALGEAAADVGRALDRGDLDAARALLPALVGRDPTGLDEKEVARAVVESVAENTVDAVVAPALWAAAAGAPGALGHRAVNTMDAVVGHRSARYLRYGWAAARLDDLGAWVPARATAALVATVRPRSAAAVARIVRRDAAAHPSPNAGVAEAAFAAALGLRLGGANRYGEPAGSEGLAEPAGSGGKAEPAGSGGKAEPAGSGGKAEPAGSGGMAWRVEVRPSLGDGRPAEPADVARAVRLSSDVGAALAVLLAAAGLAGAVPSRRRRGSGRR